MEVLISKTKPEAVRGSCRKLTWERGLQGLVHWEVGTNCDLEIKEKNKTANSNTSLDLLFYYFEKMNH